MGGNSKLSDNALTIAENRYFMEGETWQDCAERVGSEVARAENGNAKLYSDQFSEMIYEMDFLPGGRILRNTRRTRGSLFNCYVLPVGDSREEIGQWLKDALILWGEGGGIGCNMSFLRPRGAVIKGVGGSSSGPVSFLEASDAVANTIESGGSRRAAALACMHVSHPDILEFIDAKLTHGKLSHYNISVAVDDNFLTAVESNKDWQFKFAQQNYGTIPAREIWDKIIENMVNCAEPGLLNWKNLQSNNSYYFDPILATNPCIVGETLIAVADGRNYVSIKQLADEGKDVPVYSFNETSKNVEVKMMRHPRITGYNKKIFKITLDDGSFFKCNEDHKVYMKNGTIKKITDLNVGDSLDHMVKFNASFEEIFNHSNSKSQDYSWINNGYQKTTAEHRLIAEFKMGRQLESNEVVHHSNRNGLDNNPDNLDIMTKTEHDVLHAENMYGENNPMNRFPEKNWLIKQDWSGNKNGRYKGFSIINIFEKAVNLSKAFGRRITRKEWNKYCKQNGLPYSRYSIGNFKSFNSFLKAAAYEANVFVYNSSIIAREYKKYLNIIKHTDLNVFFDNGIYVKKNCEFCNETFTISWYKREQCFCSVSCSNKSRSKKINNEEFLNNTGCNYKVRAIEVCGYENVYNGTVDDNHNFYIMVNETKTKSGKVKYNHILNRQCGEVPLGSYGVCDLGSIVLPNYVKGRTTTNWKKMESVIKLAVRFLDNIIDINKYVLKEIDINAHNGRRVGVGVMGLAEYLFAKKLRYGSKEAVLEIEKLMRFIRDTVYEASVELAIEKGAFPKFDPINYGKAHFIRTLPAAMRMSIKKHGIRNVSLMAIAPTGTISLLPEATSGIEPLFRKAFMRSDRVSDRMYVHPIYEEALAKGNEDEVKEWFVDTDDLSPADHFETQSIIQKYVDGALSKTINLPKGTTTEELSALTLEYVYDLKGVTVYVDESRGEQILNKVSENDIKKHLKEKKETSKEMVPMDCATGSCDI